MKLKKSIDETKLRRICMLKADYERQHLYAKIVITTCRRSITYGLIWN